MRVLVVNAGSSSLKLRLLDTNDSVLDDLDVDHWDGDADQHEVASFVERSRTIDAVGHRVVHGGLEFREAVVVDASVEARLGALSELAPLHQPRSLAGLRAVHRLLPHVPTVACFDTSFHATIPPAAATYALPEEWRTRWQVRRYGFHGLSHSYAVRRAAAMVGRPVEELGIVSCHLGAGASLCAAAHGRSVDTTMGFTPLEGLVMQTRSGSVDPGLVLWLVERLSLDAVSDALEHRSGLAGLGGGSGDMRSVLAARTAGDERAVLAFDVYVHRLRREIAAMTAALGQLDVLVFTGGIGEHAPAVRAAAVDGLGFLGLAIDHDANETAAGDADITNDDANARTLVITAREDLEIVREVRAVLTTPQP